MLAHELEKVLKEIGKALEDNEIAKEANNFEKLVKSGKADFTKTTSYALWLLSLVCTLLRYQNKLNNHDCF